MLHRFIWPFLIIISITSTVLYILILQWPETNPNKDYLLSLITEIAGSLILAFSVFFLGNKLEEHWRSETHLRELKLQINTLKRQSKRVFQRSSSLWNFINEGPSFYFDSGWINPLYDLLTQNSRRWEQILIDAKDENQLNEDIITLMLNFIDEVESGLIIAEKIDIHLKVNVLDPTMAAFKESSFQQDVFFADKDEPINYLIHRGIIAGIDETEIVFRMSSVKGITDISLRTSRATTKVNQLLNEDKVLNKLSSELVKQRTKITSTLNKIKKALSR